MLRPGGHPPKVKEWYDKLAPLVDEAKEQLREIEPSKLVMRSGCTQTEDRAFKLTFLWRDYIIRPPEFTVHKSETGEQPSSFIQALILTYLMTANGTTPSSRWVAFRKLPDGLFYAQAFRGYAEDRLARELGDDGPAAIHRAAEKLGGESIDISDAGYAFTVLPRIHMAVVYWLGDEDFPSRASILFEDTAAYYMPTDGLAIIGSHLATAIIKASREI